MFRNRRSLIWGIPKEELISIVNKSKTYGEILRYFGLLNRGANHLTLKKRFREDNIDFSHIGKKFSGWNKGIKSLTNVLSKEDALKQIFILGNIDTHRIKRYLKRYGFIEYKCSSCGITSTWNNKPITLELDHINGNNQDNRIENLRWLCPNCHSQTPTFRGRKRRVKHYCVTCKTNEVCEDGRNCIKCNSLKNRKVKERPSINQLLKELKSYNFSEIGRKYGVTDNTIRKWIKNYSILDS